MHIDIDFVEGPEAGNRPNGVFQLDDDRLIICLGLLNESVNPVAVDHLHLHGRDAGKWKRRSPD